MTVRDLTATEALAVLGDVYRAAASRGLVVVETTLRPASGISPPLVVVRVQSFAGGRTPYEVLYETAEDIATAWRGRAVGPKNWGGRQAAGAHLVDAYVWVVGDPVMEGTVGG